MSLTVIPRIGKNVIETLTSGMYEDPRFIFREYIQNSADQIDIAVEEEILHSRQEGKIEIAIDRSSKTISVKDNATGISDANVRRFLGDVANSEKDPAKRKGFRGIGRLGGLGYCRRLVFETSAKGEAVKNTMILNADLLRSLIENKEDKSDAAAVISIITTIQTSKAPQSDHYFIVTLEDVLNEELLDEEYVKEYLSTVAPVAFSKAFKYGKKIKNHFAEKNIVLEEYDVVLNGNPVYKAYKNYLSTPAEKHRAEITSIGFFDVRDDKQQLLGVAWYGISSRLNEVIDKINPERGIRIRKSNITIGNESTLYKRFKADRTNLRYIGEIHVIGDGFVPNARRDYFNDNRTKEQFEKALDEIFKDFESKLPHRASALHNRLKDVQNFRTILEKYYKETPKFKTAEERDQRLKEVQQSLASARKAAIKIHKIEQEAASTPLLNDLFESIVGEEDYNINEKELYGLTAKEVYPPLRFSKVTKDQETILNEVVIFLQQEMGHQSADPYIRKLQKKYN